eukprot:1255443-Prymnesium_polylepis.1
MVLVRCDLRWRMLAPPPETNSRGPGEPKLGWGVIAPRPTEPARSSCRHNNVRILTWFWLGGGC